MAVKAQTLVTAVCRADLLGQMTPHLQPRQRISVAVAVMQNPAAAQQMVALPYTVAVAVTSEEAPEGPLQAQAVTAVTTPREQRQQAGQHILMVQPATQVPQTDLLAARVEMEVMAQAAQAQQAEARQPAQDQTGKAVVQVGATAKLQSHGRINTIKYPRKGAYI